MKLINLYGGPGAGKSTAAAYLFASLKHKHVKAELVGEFAKELIYLGNEVQLVNQVYIMGSQYRKQKDLERCKVDVAISDSPLGLQLHYCEDKHYYEEIKALINKLDSEFNNLNILIQRAAPYQAHGRMQTEQESDKISNKIQLSRVFDLVVPGNNKGLKTLEEFVLSKV